ncbi:DUF4440 domain-containing protein [Xanthomonas sp. Kuri4-2]
MDAALAERLRGLELRLLDPAVRASAAELERLLDPAFVEFGVSGGRFERADLLAALPAAAPAGYRACGFEAELLAPGLVQLRYRSVHTREGVQVRARRSSLWRLGPDGWRLLFHQGTAFTDDAALC